MLHKVLLSLAAIFCQKHHKWDLRASGILFSVQWQDLSYVLE